MSATAFPADAVSGSPSYTGRMGRQALGALMGGRYAGRMLGGSSGVAAGTDSSILAVTSTTWTVHAHNGWYDLESAAIAGPQLYAFDADVTGSVTAADATNQRVDSLFVRQDDPAEGDGSATPQPNIVYVAGTPGAAGGARGAAGGPPNIPARCFELAQITVPAVGGGNPAISLVAKRVVATGGIRPCTGTSDFPANPYVGQVIHDGTTLAAWNGSAWGPVAGVTTAVQLQVSSAGDFTSGTMTTLVTCSPAIPVPPWARDGSAKLILTAAVNAIIISNPGWFNVRVALNNVVPAEAPQQVSGNAGTAAEGAQVTCGGTFTVGAGATSVAPVVQAQRTSGTGALRTNGGLIVWTAYFTR